LNAAIQLRLHRLAAAHDLDSMGAHRQAPARRAKMIRAHRQRSTRTVEHRDGVRSADPVRESAPAGRAPPELQNQVVQALYAARTLRAKLDVGGTSDPEEADADRVARGVMGQEPPCTCGTGVPCASCGSSGPTVRRKRAGKRHAPDMTGNLGLGRGRPLGASERGFFEPRLGADLSEVRVHDDPAAARAAGHLDARAFTVGRDIAFARNAFEPYTHAGRELLAHELAHVLQGGSVVRRERNQSRIDENASYAPPPEPNQSSITDPVQVTHDKGFDPCKIDVSALTNYGLLAEYYETLAKINRGKQEPDYRDYRNLQRRLIEERDRRVEMGHAWLAGLPHSIPARLLTIVEAGGGRFHVVQVNPASVSGMPTPLGSAGVMTQEQFDAFLSSHDVERMSPDEYLLHIAPPSPSSSIPPGGPGGPFLPPPSTQFFGSAFGLSNLPLALPNTAGPVPSGVFAEGVNTLDYWAQPFELGYGSTIMTRLAKGGSVALDAPITFDIDEPLPVGDKNIKPQRAVQRALDPHNRQLLDSFTNQRTKGLGIDFRDLQRSKTTLEAVSVKDDPSAIYVRRFDEVIELNQVFNEAVARIPNVNALKPTQIKAAINRNMLDIISNGETPAGIAVRDAFGATGFGPVPGRRLAALQGFVPPGESLNLGTTGAKGAGLGGLIAVATAGGFILIDPGAHPRWKEELAVSGGIGTGAGFVSSTTERMILVGGTRAMQADLAATGTSALTRGALTGVSRFGGGAVGAVFVEGISMGLLEEREHSGLEIGVRSTRAAALGGGSVWAGAAIGTAVGGPVGFIVGLAVGGVLYYVGDKIVPGGREDWDALEQGCVPRPVPTVDIPEPKYHYCFARGTRILGPGGAATPIETLATGDTVLCVDEQSGQIQEGRVARAFHSGRAPCQKVFLSDGAVLQITGAHPVALGVADSVRWVDACSLVEGQTLFAANDGARASCALPIARIEPGREDLDVFDLTVETCHNYFAERILVHNKMI
jgi:hypothetical protein